MAKLTFRRVLNEVLLRTAVNAALPLVGGLLFLVGSIFFWPGVRVTKKLFKSGDDFVGPSDVSEDIGAALYLAGSVAYLIAPVVDFIDMSFSIMDIAGTDEALPTKQAPPAENSPLVIDYKQLYTAQMIRTQRVNTVLYVSSGICFTIGSIFFFPELKAESTHGAWLYLMGCMVSLTGAILAASTAHEAKKTRATRPPSYYPKEEGRFFTLWWWGHEDAQIYSCALYVVGDVIYSVGSILYFPKIFVKNTNLVLDKSHISEKAAVILFIIGSVVFVIGSTIDLLVLLRVRYPLVEPPPKVGKIDTP